MRFCWKDIELEHKEEGEEREKYVPLRTAQGFLGKFWTRGPTCNQDFDKWGFWRHFNNVTFMTYQRDVNFCYSIHN